MIGRRGYMSSSRKSHTCADSKIWVSASMARSIVGLPPRSLSPHSLSKDPVLGSCGHFVTQSHPPVKRDAPSPVIASAPPVAGDSCGLTRLMVLLKQELHRAFRQPHDP